MILNNSVQTHTDHVSDCSLSTFFNLQKRKHKSSSRLGTLTNTVKTIVISVNLLLSYLIVFLRFEVNEDYDHVLGAMDSLLHQLADREDLDAIASKRMKSGLLHSCHLS